jgi:hypothetical protein
MLDLTKINIESGVASREASLLKGGGVSGIVWRWQSSEWIVRNHAAFTNESPRKTIMDACSNATRIFWSKVENG